MNITHLAHSSNVEVARNYFNRLPFDILRSHIFPKLSPIQIIDILSFPQVFGLAPVLMQESFLSQLRKQISQECVLQYLRRQQEISRQLFTSVECSIKMQANECIRELKSSKTSKTLLIDKLLPQLPWPIIRYDYLFLSFKDVPGHGFALYYHNRLYYNAIPFQFIEVLRALRISRWEQFSQLIPNQIPWISFEQNPVSTRQGPMSPLDSDLEIIRYDLDLPRCICLAKSTDHQVEDFQIGDFTLKIINQQLTQEIVRTFYNEDGRLEYYEYVDLPELLGLIDEVSQQANSLLEFCLINAINIFIQSEEFLDLLTYLRDHHRQDVMRIVNLGYLGHEQTYLLPIACEYRDPLLVKLLLELGADLNIDNRILSALLIDNGHSGYFASSEEKVEEILQILLAAGLQPELFRESLEECDFISYCSEFDYDFDNYPPITRQVILSIYPDFLALLEDSRLNRGISSQYS